MESDRAPIENEKEDAESARSLNLLGDETYPEGGKEAWLVVFGSCCGLIASLGLVNTNGTFQAYISKHQLADYSESTIGWIFGLNTALCFFCGVYIGPLFDKYGPRWLIGPGSILIIAGIMLFSVCTEYWHFITVYSIVLGLADSLLFTPSIAAIGHFFRERRGIASGVASTGGGIGGIVFPLMLQALFSKVGWAWAIRALGFLSLVLLIPSNIFVKKRLKAPKNLSPHPDIRIFKDPAFLLLTIGVFLLEFGLFIPLTYISSYALANGFTESFAFQILPILNAGSVLGRIIPGWWADKVGPFNSNMACMLLTIISCFAIWLPFGHTTPGLVVFAVLFGFATGNNISITPVCVGKLCHTQHYGRYYATCYTVVSVACLINIPIAGTVVAATNGNYTWLIVFTGATQVAALFFIYAAKVAKTGWKPWTKF
ncbi:major facilitator superfamily transporter [Xylariaceae sp. FL1019]|nr:major facilitator superfamily transporter [Xylariaceae sp. FL1019]